MDTLPGSGAKNEPGKGLQFRMTVSMGNLIQLGALMVMGVVGWTTIQDRQASYDQQQKDEAIQIRQIVIREEQEAELNARQAAIVDELEKRIARVELQEDKTVRR